MEERACLVVVIICMFSLSIAWSASAVQQKAAADSGVYLGSRLKALEAGLPDSADALQKKQSGGPEYFPGEIIVKFREKTPETMKSGAFGKFAKKYGVKKSEAVFAGVPEEAAVSGEPASPESAMMMQTVGMSSVFKMHVDPGSDVESIVEELRKNPDVEYAEPNYIYHIMATPNDPSFPEQWAHQKISSQSAWDIETGDPQVVIAIIDTGVDWNHPDLSASIWSNADEVVDGVDNDGNGYVDDIRGYDFVNNATGEGCYNDDCEDEDSDPMDRHTHGSHCAGIAAAATDNGIGIAGVCWTCRVMPVRAGFNSYYGGTLKEDDTAQAIKYAADNGADVISMSFGGPHSQLIEDAIDYAYSRGVILVAAAGNSNTDLKYSSYPAAYDNVIAVSSTDSSDGKSSFSNYGQWVDVAAPGSSILSTIYDDTYTTYSGTSMACPHVAGLAGLILSKNPSLTAGEVGKIIKSSSDPINTQRYMGFGRINAYSALSINSVPNSNISGPVMGAVVGGQISVTGTATGLSFVNYSLMYGSGPYPSAWTIVKSSSIEVAGAEISKWETRVLDDGEYTLKLLVYNSDGWSEDRVFVRVLNNATTCFSCSDCNYKIGSLPQSSFAIVDDISSDGSCIEITRDSVSLDCEGNAISGQGYGEGISINSADGVSLKNCTVQNFGTGVLIEESRMANLSHNRLNSNVVGLFVTTETYNTDYYNHYIYATNLVDGRTVNYYYGLDDQAITGLDSGHLEVADSTNVTVSGNSIYGDGMKLDAVTDSDIGENSISNAFTGIYLDKSAVNNTFSENTITKNQGYKYGIYFEDYDSLFNHIADTNTVNSEAVVHLYMDRGTPQTRLQPPSRILTVANVTNLGKVTLVNCGYADITGFTVSGNEIGIYAYGSDGVRIFSNSVSDNNMGISLEEMTDAQVYSNDVQNNVFSGIFSTSSVNTTITGNSVMGTKSCTFVVDFSFFTIDLDLGGMTIDSGHTASGNTLANNNCSGIAVYGEGSMVSGNTFSGNNGGIFIAGNYNNFTGNHITKPDGEYGLNFFSSLTTYNYIDQSNTVNSEPVYHFYNSRNSAADPMEITDQSLSAPMVSTLGRISVLYSDFINITRVSASGNTNGVFIYNSTGVEISDSDFDAESIGVHVSSSSGVQIYHSDISGASSDLNPYGTLLFSGSDFHFWENNVYGSGNLVYSDSPRELSRYSSGNFWGHTDPPYFTAGNDSSNESVKDSHPYGKASGWLDETSPVLSFSDPTLPNGSHTNSQWIAVRVSADENLTSCLLHVEGEDQNRTMEVIRDNVNTYCQLNATFNQSGWKKMTVYANDSSYNWNSLGDLWIRINVPPVLHDYSISPALVLAGENVSISASLLDEDNVTGAQFTISNETFSDSYQPSPCAAGYCLEYTASLGEGKYNVTMSASDDLGSAMSVVIGGFEVREPKSLSLALRNHAGSPRNMSISVIDPSSGYVREYAANSSDASFSVPAGLWDINLSSGFSVLLKNVNISRDLSGYLTLDDVPTNPVQPPEHRKFVKIVAGETNITFGPSYIFMPYAGLITRENNIVVYRCSGWSMSGRSCPGGDAGWGNKLRSGQDYAINTQSKIIRINLSGFSAYAGGEEIPYCGNGVVDDQTEECDGGDFAGETCSSLGYSSGSLDCTSSCQFDTSGCGGSGGGGDTTFRQLQITGYTQYLEADSGYSKQFSVTVKNTGTLNLSNISLSFSTSCHGCSFQMTPASVNLSPQQIDYFQATVFVPSSQQESNYTINVTASSSGTVSPKVTILLRVKRTQLSCSPGALMCSATTGNLLKCLPDGSGWLTDRVCPSGCLNNACRPANVCTPGQKRCSGDILQQCRQDGSGWGEVADCGNGCDPSTLACKATLPPAGGDGSCTDGEQRCSGNSMEFCTDGKWETVQECPGGCENYVCRGGSSGGQQQGSGMESSLILGLVMGLIISGCLLYYYRSRVSGISWGDLEHKWETIRTTAAEIEGNLMFFLNKKVTLTGKILESMLYEDTGIVGSTLDDSSGQILVYSGQPEPSGDVHVTGWVRQNETGNVYIQSEHVKRRSQLTFFKGRKKIRTPGLNNKGVAP